MRAKPLRIDMTASIGVARVAVACLALVAGACSVLPSHAERITSTAFLDTDDTRLGRAVEPELASHPAQSGFHAVGGGADAFLVRVAMARAAERSLDVQYYIFHDDDTGSALLGELLDAADRGVRVRLLLDDIHNKGRDAALAAIDAHPQVEVRVYNPFAHRRARWIDLLTDYGRVNRRMHNKSMTADNQVSVVGGRNVGDEYFAAGTAVEFGDFDVAAIGPIVREVSAEFDRYWNSDVVYPIASLVRAPKPSALLALRTEIARRMDHLRGTEYARALTTSDLALQLAEGRVAHYWGKATVIADDPSKVSVPVSDVSTHAGPKLFEVLGEAQEELFLVSPYFVPGEHGVRWLAGFVERGVRVRILTNSFAATDVGVVHAGYAAHRKALLRAGVELDELKPSAGIEDAPPGKQQGAGSSSSSLHAKTYMVDARTLFVGSLNLDPRSVKWNTEMGIVIECESLCAALRERLLLRLPDVAYRVELDEGHDDGARLSWTTRENGREVRVASEPGVGFLDSLALGLLRLLPIEDQL